MENFGKARMEFASSNLFRESEILCSKYRNLYSSNSKGREESCKISNEKL